MNRRIRQLHRWVSAAFTLAVVVVFAAPLVGTPPEWLYYLPLAPLAVLLPSGVYLFALPYVARAGGKGSSPR